MFSLPHIMVIIFASIFIPLYCIHLRHSSKEKADHFFKFFAIIIPFFEPLDLVGEYMTKGRLDPSTCLPLYMCSLFMITLPFAVFLKPGLAKRIALANIATIGAIGGAFGLIFNIYVDQYPFFSYVPIRSLTYHFIMLLVSAAVWPTGYYKRQKGDEFLCFIPFLIMMIPAVILNRLYGYDYLYTAGAKGTALASISSMMPTPVFVIVLWGFMWFCIRVVFYHKTSYKVSDLVEKLKAA